MLDIFEKIFIGSALIIAFLIILLCIVGIGKLVIALITA